MPPTMEATKLWELISSRAEQFLWWYPHKNCNPNRNNFSNLNFVIRKKNFMIRKPNNLGQGPNNRWISYVRSGRTTTLLILSFSFFLSFFFWLGMWTLLNNPGEEEPTWCYVGISNCSRQSSSGHQTAFTRFCWCSMYSATVVLILRILFTTIA